MLFVLFRLIKKRSFNLLCVLDLFSECWQSTLFQIFLVKYLHEHNGYELRANSVKYVACPI